MTFPSSNSGKHSHMVSQLQGKFRKEASITPVTEWCPCFQSALHLPVFICSICDTKVDHIEGQCKSLTGNILTSKTYFVEKGMYANVSTASASVYLSHVTPVGDAGNAGGKWLSGFVTDADQMYDSMLTKVQVWHPEGTPQNVGAVSTFSCITDHRVLLTLLPCTRLPSSVSSAQGLSATCTK